MAKNTQVTAKICGTYLHVEQGCSTCLNVVTWGSQPFVNNQPAGNILLSASIMSTGALPTNVLCALNNMGCVTVADWTFLNITIIIFISQFQLSRRSTRQCFLGSCDRRRDNLLLAVMVVLTALVIQPSVEATQ